MSHDWGNRITRYRDTVTEDSPALINGAVNMLRTDNVKVNEYTSFTVESDKLVRLVVRKDYPGFDAQQILFCADFCKFSPVLCEFCLGAFRVDWLAPSQRHSQLTSGACVIVCPCMLDRIL